VTGRGLLTALATSGLVLLAGVAAAATAPPSTATDPRDDTAGALDLSRGSLARSGDGRVRLNLTLAESWTGKDLLADGDGRPPGSLCGKLWTAGQPPAAPPDYLVCATADADGTLRGSILRVRANALPERSGRATVSRPSERSITLRFAQSAIGRPATLRAAGEATEPGCRRASCTDTVPDAPGVLTLVLRAAKT
jgi:hypothetical protein